ncbi:MAG: glycosyltransferase family 39 protein [Candidatus Omnitrophica bacterium]|jgi:hypothetical protein|nr:glycosyltransferase family 39 protein [Candidatus Omnitrophota bacterium]
MVKSKSVLFVLTIFLVASLNHLLTFMAYDWFAGIDNYSYDVAGLQLLSGHVFDLFPIIFRPPFVPIVKNILYLIFEGKPYLFAIFLHLLGIATVLLAYRLGSHLNKMVGFITGLLVALSLPMSVFFHQVSTFTFFVPLLILAADRFIVWIKRPNLWTSASLAIIVSFCFLSRMEAISLILVFSIFGWLGHKNWRQLTVFFAVCIGILMLLNTFYYVNFGYWGVTYNKGWALFTRLTRAEDHQFDIANGYASAKIGDYMKMEWPSRVKDTHPIEFQMYVLNLVQKDLGYFAADRLFFQAGLEAIRKDPLKFIKFTFFRTLGQLDLFEFPGLNHKEFPFQSESGHMWGFSGKREQERAEKFQHWHEDLLRIDSPLKWEKMAIKQRIRRLVGLKNSEPPEPPPSFKMVPNVTLINGAVATLHCSDGNMGERLYSCLDLDIYYFLKYWGQKKTSLKALKILRLWDVLMPKARLRINLHRFMWFFWVIGIAVSRKRWHVLVLSALLSFVVLYALTQAIFSDNFGGRFELYTRVFLWLGASYGIWALFRLKKTVNNSDN